MPTAKNDDSLSTEPHFISKRELARRYSVSVRTVQSWVARRIIPYIRMGGGPDGAGGMLRFNPRACDAAISRFGGVQELPVTQTRKRRKTRGLCPSDENKTDPS